MTNKEFETRQHELNEQIDTLMKERAEHERQWYNELNRRLDALRGRCFKTIDCMFIVDGSIYSKKTATEFLFYQTMIPVIMVTNDSRIISRGNFHSSTLIYNESVDAILKDFRKEFEEIPKQEFIDAVVDILKEKYDDGT